jgi:hypothetical protein
MSHLEFFLSRINLFLPDLYAVIAKKSQIFSLSLHINQVKRVLSVVAKSLRRLINGELCNLCNLWKLKNCL